MCAFGVEFSFISPSSCRQRCAGSTGDQQVLQLEKKNEPRNVTVAEWHRSEKKKTRLDLHSRTANDPLALTRSELSLISAVFCIFKNVRPPDDLYEPETDPGTAAETQTNSSCAVVLRAAGNPKWRRNRTERVLKTRIPECNFGIRNSTTLRLCSGFEEGPICHLSSDGCFFNWLLIRFYCMSFDSNGGMADGGCILILDGNGFPHPTCPNLSLCCSNCNISQPGGNDNQQAFCQSVSADSLLKVTAI